MKNSDYEPFGPFSRPSPDLTQRSSALYRPTAQVTRCNKIPDSAAPVEIVPGIDSRRYDQAKVHGAKAALTFLADETRAGEPTVTVECAARLEGAERIYAWGDKLRFQLTGTELQLLTCLLLGGVKELSFRNHGDKWCGVSRQTVAPYTGTIRITMGQGEAAKFAPRTVAIDHVTLGPVAALCLRQSAHLLRVPVEAAPTILRAVACAYTDQSRLKNDGGMSAHDGVRVRASQEK